LMFFLVVFRTNQANQRFQEGTALVYTMQADFCESASLLIAFARSSKAASREKIANFQHTTIRLVSMLGASCMVDLAGCDRLSKGGWVSKYANDMIDIGRLDPATLLFVEQVGHKSETILQLIQHLVTSQIGEVLDTPSTLLTRAFQEMGNGMIKYQEAMKLAAVPMPYPYMIVTDFLILIYTCATPVAMVAWSNSAATSSLFVVVQVFTMWSLTLVAAELDNPFGVDLNDLNMGVLQAGYNKRLTALLKCCGNDMPTPYVDSSAGLIDAHELLAVMRTNPTVLRVTNNRIRQKIMLPGKMTNLGCVSDPELTYSRLLELATNLQQEIDTKSEYADLARSQREKISICKDPEEEGLPEVFISIPSRSKESSAELSTPMHIWNVPGPSQESPAELPTPTHIWNVPRLEDEMPSARTEAQVMQGPSDSSAR